MKKRQAPKRPTKRRAPATGGPLARIGTSALYAPPGGETWVFLLWDSTSPPATIALEETWADRGSPQYVGDYVFTLSIPTAAGAGAFEAMLRQIFAPPAGATGFGWVGKSATGATAVAASLALQQPIVSNDTLVHLPSSVLSFGFLGKTSLVSARDAGGAMTGLLATMPMPKSAPLEQGIVLPLVGKFAGCIEFSGALRSKVDDDSTDKQLANVRIDPLRITDRFRTRISPLPVVYVLSDSASGYTFLPLT